ncbi:MAG: histidine kinase [Mycobacterium sp.]|nr:histidine kinase [Mycobacterium sp.]
MNILGRKRADLRIYLGAAPGVGKTYSMLGEAHRRMERGTDVVAAWIETHGRRRTAQQLAGIEVIPPTLVEHEGTRRPEIDVDAVLARRPQVVLVDDLAHANTPGSRNAHRWQDVDDFLNAGITVITTVNVQHLESLNDVVSHITGTAQLQRVPDEFVRRADQIELVDITPEALRRRIAHGNVYPPEQAAAAMEDYFRPGNLSALRQLALLWLADQVDAALARYRDDKNITDTWEARERVVVAVSGGPESETLVRRASRIASRSGADLKVVHVIAGDGLIAISPQQKKIVRELAASLGATLHTVVGGDVATTLLDFARSNNATQLVIGTSRRSRWARTFDEGIGAQVIQQSGNVDVHMVTHAEAHTGISWSRQPTARRRVLSWLVALVIPAAICAVTTWVPADALGIGGQSALFFTGVLLVALLGGLGPAALCALLSGVLLTYFLVSPVHSFAVYDSDSATTVLVLLLVAVAVAALVDRTARRAAEARRATQEAELLALFADSALRDGDVDVLLDRLRETYTQRAVSIVAAGGNLVASAGPDPCADVDSADTAVEVGDHEFWMLMAGRTLTARDRRVLGAVAEQAVAMLTRRR